MMMKKHSEVIVSTKSVPRSIFRSNVYEDYLFVIICLISLLLILFYVDMNL